MWNQERRSRKLRSVQEENCGCKGSVRRETTKNEESVIARKRIRVRQRMKVYRRRREDRQKVRAIVSSQPADG